MTKPKFTEGPWRISDVNQTHIISGDHRGICSTGGFSDGTERTYFENINNAQLIASAPCMYEALTALVFASENQGVDTAYKTKAFLSAKEALAKAEGRKNEQ